MKVSPGGSLHFFFCFAPVSLHVSPPVSLLSHSLSRPLSRPCLTPPVLRDRGWHRERDRGPLCLWRPCSILVGTLQFKVPNLMTELNLTIQQQYSILNTPFFSMCCRQHKEMEDHCQCRSETNFLQNDEPQPLQDVLHQDRRWERGRSRRMEGAPWAYPTYQAKEYVSWTFISLWIANNNSGFDELYFNTDNMCDLTICPSLSLQHSYHHKGPPTSAPVWPHIWPPVSSPV